MIRWDGVGPTLAEEAEMRRVIAIGSNRTQYQAEKSLDVRRARALYVEHLAGKIREVDRRYREWGSDGDRAEKARLVGEYERVSGQTWNDDLPPAA